MYYLDLFQQDPAEIILTLLFSLLITTIAYSAFPLIFAFVRKKFFKKWKYRLLCFGVNFVVNILFSLNSFISYGEVSSGGAFILWTFVFSAIGIKILNKKGVFDEPKAFQPIHIASDSESNNPASSGSSMTENPVAASPAPPTQKENPPIMFCRRCGFKLTEDCEFCGKCGTKIEKGSEV